MYVCSAVLSSSLTIFHVYCFDFMYVREPHACTMPSEGTRGHWALDMESQIVGDPHHGDAGGHAGVL